MYKTESGREITFLGAGNSEIRANHIKYGELESLDQLFSYLLASCWTDKTVCKACEKSYDHAVNPSAGQCSITAALVQDIFGGDIIRVTYADESTHFLNRINDQYIDLSSDQFTINGKDSLQGEKIEAVDRNDCLRDMNFVMKHNILSINLCRAVATDLKAKHGDALQREELPEYNPENPDIASHLDQLQAALEQGKALEDNQYYSTVGERDRFKGVISKAESASFAMIKLSRLCTAQTLMTAASVATEPNARQLMLNDSIYKKSGLICEAEKQDLLELIQIVREKL